MCKTKTVLISVSGDVCFGPWFTTVEVEVPADATLAEIETAAHNYAEQIASKADQGLECFPDEILECLEPDYSSYFNYEVQEYDEDDEDAYEVACVLVRDAEGKLVVKEDEQ